MKDRDCTSLFTGSSAPLACSSVALKYTFSKSESTILDDLTMTASRGDFLAVAGRSGSGKTSLLRVLYGMQEPSNGTVWWGDRKLTELNEKQRQKLR
ncbi:ATP-binding cassette domain-containing protein, partial [Arachnia propionica]